MIPHCCSTCRHLDDCQDACDHALILDTHRCKNWFRAERYELEARKVLKDTLGSQALRFGLVKQEPSAKPRRRR